MVDELVFVVPASGVVEIARHHFKFLFLLSGEISHEIEGLEGCHILRAGDVLAAPPVQYHRYRNPDPNREARIHAVRLFIDEVALCKHAKNRPLKPEPSLSAFVLNHFPDPVHLSGGIDSGMREVLLDLRKETEERRLGFRHRVHSLCTDLLVLTARKISQKGGRPRTAQSSQTVEGAMEYLQKHFTDPGLRLGQVAWHTGKGEEHLARVFKRETGHSVFDHVREMRINHAKTLLLDPSLSLTTVAARSGFQSLAFFSRSFKQIAGLAPSEYRRNMDLELQTAPVPNHQKRSSREAL